MYMTWLLGMMISDDDDDDDDDDLSFTATIVHMLG